MMDPGDDMVSTPITNPKVHVVRAETHVLQSLKTIVANDDNYALAA